MNAGKGLEGIVKGFSNGFVTGIDPAGSLYTTVRGKEAATIGSIGSHERILTYTPAESDDGTVYTLSKWVGAGSGFLFNVAHGFLPQLASGAVDVYWAYRDSKKGKK